MLTKLRPIPHDELGRLAAGAGPDSYAAGMLTELRERRARDEQVFAFRLGEFIVIGPTPSPEEELQLTLAYEATKDLKGSKALELITDADVVEMVGEPDEIITEAERMRARRWICSTCAEIIESADPIPVPAPCKRCGGIAFRTG